jgi:chemotaxis protein CheY-P-specific phosphatase CheC
MTQLDSATLEAGEASSALSRLVNVRANHLFPKVALSK